MMSQKIRSYRELRRLESFEERYDYLQLKDFIGRSTFGFDRYLNQLLYKSKQWLKVRNDIIIRDKACDLGIDGYDITNRIVIHHMNPLTPEDIKDGKEIIFDPEFLICTSNRTHLSIHYGDKSLLYKPPVIRRPGDTIPWFNG